MSTQIISNLQLGLLLLLFGYNLSQLNNFSYLTPSTTVYKRPQIFMNNVKLIKNPCGPPSAETRRDTQEFTSIETS